MTVARRKAAHAQRGKAELNPHDALVLLTAEHNEIDKLAREFERLRKAADTVDKGKAALGSATPWNATRRSSTRSFIPPPMRCWTGEDKELLGKSQVKHDGIQDLIEKIENTSADDPSFDATVAVLAEQAGRLMKQEEEQLFPRLRHSRLDLLGTGERMAARKTELGTAPIDRERVRQARKVMSGR